MQIHITRTRGVTVLRCDGRLVLGHAATKLRRVATRALAECQVVTLDLAGIRQMDAHGIGVLILLYHSSRNHGSTLLLTRVSDRVHRLLDLSGLFAIIPLTAVLDADGTVPIDRHRADRWARADVAVRPHRAVAQRVNSDAAGS